MKRIGILGGSSDQATADYYRRLNAAVNAKLGGSNTAETLINSMNFKFAADGVLQGRWDELAVYLTERAKALEAAGADLLICVSNTLHKLAPAFTAGLSIPFLHIVDPTGAAIAARGFKRVAFLGTQAAMSGDHLHNRYRDLFGIEAVVPPGDVQEKMNQIIFQELCMGRFTPAAKQYYLDVMAEMHGAGAEGVILGCTEIPLLVGQSDLPQVPMFDTTGLHVDAIVAFALK